jgi:hypothetical protein
MLKFGAGSPAVDSGAAVQVGLYESNPGADSGCRPKRPRLVYAERWVAPFVLLPIMFGTASFVHFRARAKVRPYLAAAHKRVEALQSALGEDRDPNSERRAFAET